jgi:hypothetical protein
MKNDNLKHISLFIVLVILFSITATAFTLFDDISPSYGISACDTDDDLGHADEAPLAEVPSPSFACLAPLHTPFLSHITETFIPIQATPFLNHISRAPPFSFS